MALGDTIVASLAIDVIVRGQEKLADLGRETRAAGVEAEGLGSKFGKMGTAVGLGFGAAAAAVAAYSVHAASDFNTATMHIANNTAMTTGQLEEMRQQVLKLGDSSPAPLDEIAQGFEKAANAGYEGKAAFDLVKVSMQAAVETGGKVPDTVDAVTGALKQFQLPASDAAHVLGEMMAAAADGDMHLPDLATNFTKVGGLAGSMHQPLDQVLADFSSITRVTHSAALAQTEFAGMLAHISNPTKQATDEMAKLKQMTGIDLPDAFNKTAHGQMTLNELLLKAKEATKGDTSALNELFGGQRGGQAAIALINAAWKDHLKILDAVRSHTDEVGKQWKRTTDEVDTQAGILRNNVEHLAITIGETLIPTVNTYVKDAIPVVQAINNVAKSHTTATSAILGTGIAIGGTSLAIRGVNYILEPFGASVGKLGGLALTAGRTMLGFGAASTEAGAGIGAVAAPLGVLTAGGLAAYTAAGILAKRTAVDWTSAMRWNAQDLERVNNGLVVHKTAAEQAAEGMARVNALEEGNASTLKAVIQEQDQFAGTSAQQFHQAVDQINNSLNPLGQTIKNVLIEGISTARATTVAQVEQIHQKYDEMRQGIIQDLQNTNSQSRQLWDAQRLAALNSAEQQKVAVVKAAEDQKDQVVIKAAEQKDGVIQANLAERKQVLANTKQASSELYTQAANQAAKLIQEANTSKNGVVKAHLETQAKSVLAWANLKQGVLTAGQSTSLGALATARTMRDKVIEAHAQMAKGAIQKVSDMKPEMEKSLQGLASGAVQQVSQMRSRAIQEVSGMKTGMVQQATQAHHGVLDQMTQMKADVVDHSPVPDMHRAVVQHLTQMNTESVQQASAMNHGVVAQMNAMKASADAAVQSMISTIESEMAAFVGQAQSYGAAAGNAFAAGLASSAPAAAAAGASVLAAAKASLEFHSPNKLGDDPELWGRNVAKSFASGLTSGIPLVQAAAMALLNAVKTAGDTTQGIGGSGIMANGNNAALLALTQALSKLPPDFQAAGQHIVDGFSQKLEAANEKYLAAVAQAHQKGVEAIHKAVAVHDQQVAKAGSDYATKLQNIHASANEQLRHYLQDHRIQMTAENQRALAALSQHEQQVMAQRQKLEQDMLHTSSAAQAAADQRQINALDAANKQWIAEHAKAMGITTKAQQQMLEEWIKHHANVLNESLAKAKQMYDKHVADLNTTEQNSVKATKQAYEDHVAGLKKALDESTKKIAQAIQEATTPSGILSGIQSQAQKAYDNAIAQATLDVLEHGQATVRDMNAIAKAQATLDKLTAAQQKAAQVTETTSQKISDQQTQLQDSLQAALDQYTYDLQNHTGDLQADSLAIQQAYHALDLFTNAQNKASAQIPAATQATAANTTATQQNTGATEQATQATQAVVQSFSDLQNAANTTANQALDALAMAIMTGQGDITALANAAITAANNAQAFATALQQAQAMVQQASTPSSSTTTSAPTGSTSNTPTGLTSSGGTMDLQTAQNLLAQVTAQYAADKAAGAAASVLQNDQDYLAFYQQLVATLESSAQASALAGMPSGSLPGNPNSQLDAVTAAMNAEGLANQKLMQDQARGASAAIIAADKAAVLAASKALSAAYMNSAGSTTGDTGSVSLPTSSSTDTTNTLLQQQNDLLQKQLTLLQQKYDADTSSWQTFLKLCAETGTMPDLTGDGWLTSHLATSSLTSA